MTIEAAIVVGAVPLLVIFLLAAIVLLALD